jgi:hypothetical protein
MGQRRPTKTDIVDAIIGEATRGQFTGDKRDGAPPPITLQNFLSETFRYGAKALRARLSRLTLAELLLELEASVVHVEMLQEHVKGWLTQYERDERAANVRARSERQSELAKRPHPQPAIVTAARHYRDLGMNAGEAWDVINKTPFATDAGNTVEIVGSKLPRLKQRMRVILRDGRQQKRSIGFDQWRQRYWSAAGSLAKPTTGPAT